MAAAPSSVAAKKPHFTSGGGGSCIAAGARNMLRVVREKPPIQIDGKTNFMMNVCADEMHCMESLVPNLLHVVVDLPSRRLWSHRDDRETRGKEIRVIEGECLGQPKR